MKWNAFPAPTTIDATLFGFATTVTLPAGDKPGDTYEWGEVFCYSCASVVFLGISDLTTGGQPIICGGDDDTGCGTLSFNKIHGNPHSFADPVATPEPGTIVLGGSALLLLLAKSLRRF